MPDSVLQISNLKVTFATQDGSFEAVQGASFEVSSGETIAIVGESGSGKSQSMMAVMGLLPRNGRATGKAVYSGQNLIGLPKAALNEIRGKKIAMIFQEPMTSLDPLYRVGSQMMEPLQRHSALSRKSAEAHAIDLLRLVKIPDPERRMRSYPHELSGGQRQRVMIAMALANNPDVLIADEPTTALDVTIQAEILELLGSLQKRLGMALIFITHDLGIVRRIANRVYVMKGGEVVEHGDVQQIFAKPQHSYTKALLAAEPKGRKQQVAASAETVLEARDMRVTFRLGGGLFAGPPHDIKAVDRVNLTLREGQTIGIVGESGSGKSTLARALLRLLPAEGRVIFNSKDISSLDVASLRPIRKELQIVFQDPFGSLSPRLTVGQIISEGLLVHEPNVSRAERETRAVAAMLEVGLDPDTRNRYPHEFSGGQRQRIAIARAMILKPKVVVLDEPTSALDRQVQSQIVELLRRLQSEKALSYIFISHDLAVVRALADTVIVMRNGQVVEQGATADVMNSPRSDYTKLLMKAALSSVSDISQAKLN